jgi:bacillithiol system protein YtxJ
MRHITSPEEWQALKDDCASQKKDLFLAKLSPACPVSHAAEAVLDQWVPKHPQETFITARIDVIRARNLSRSIADEVGIKHESPQVLHLNSEAQPIWNASHYTINAENLDQQFPQ